MRNRFRSALIAALTLIASQLAVAPVGAVVAQKVVIIVGPTGAQTASYRSKGDDIATSAEAAGATVVKVYSPSATWANVKAAVNGANVVVYLGHGNGFPNPYNTTEPTDRDNGWGLNRTTSGGDTDNWSTTMVYCGEKALLGTLTSASSAQWSYCGGSTNTDGITPAPNWVMVYSNACYAPGASEGSDVPATESVALARVKNYSYPALLLGAGAYFATDMGSQPLVEDILENPDMAFGELAERAHGYDLYRQRHFAHPDLPGKRIWIQNTGSPTSGNYFFAYAGTPDLTPSGNTVAYTEPSPPAVPTPAVVGSYPTSGSTGVSTAVQPGVQFDRVVSGVGTGSFVMRRPNGTNVAAVVTNNGNSMQFTLHPSAALEAGTTFTISLTAAISGVEGGQLVPTSWSFTTAGTPPPPSSGPTTYSPPTQVIFKMGTHTGYKFSTTGGVTASKSFTLTKDSGAATSTRTPVANQSGNWLYITNGVWAGYWVRESSVLYVAVAPVGASPAPNANWNPTVQLLFKKGVHTGYKFNPSTGAMTAEKSYTLTNDSGAATSSRAALAYQSGTWFYVTNGVWAGYWVRSTDVVMLASS